MKSYYTRQLSRLLRYKEIERIEISKEEFWKKLDMKIASLKLGEFQFSFSSNEKFVYLEKKNLPDKLILRQLNNRLRKVYKDEQSNRRKIIKQIKTLLNETADYYIVRSDIKSFYDSIKRKPILEKIKNDRLLSFESIFLVEAIFSHPAVSSEGLPKGLSISSTLSEIYLRKFDRWVRSSPGVFFYARFVDDIIIFLNTKSSLNRLYPEISKNLPDGLEINNRKTSTTSLLQLQKGKQFEYLGYSFSLEKIEKKKFNLKISIAESKVKKIKSRILASLVDYIKNNDFDLLFMRMKFLSSNYKIRTSQSGRSLKAGIFYNYPEVNDLEIINEINCFYHKSIRSSSGSFGIKLSQALSSSQKNKLSSLSFKHGFNNKVCYTFSGSEIKRIKSCWK